MKINLLGTFGVIGVVASFTAACGGSPTKPTASNPFVGDGGSAPSVNISNPRTVIGLEVCANQPPASDDPYGDGQPAPVAMCDVYAPDEPAADVAADEVATDDVVISEASTDEILSARTFRR
jgi:hypothetical protein